ncbi:uncharacterized protein J8A68_005682 [[Candida] subhashii]|uniref:RING-type domain-containing protein n=1 Tax=[Candida] subhashii TaxID=561895 RepID=A0A8J5QLR9_9ASCO|nr:uncharacterized protein J8A68_005682 [[Candida] subhashii]KAG7660865.1 hypothetical protein J8A68_005682 [[Candida] subhashii]
MASERTTLLQQLSEYPISTARSILQQSMSTPTTTTTTVFDTMDAAAAAGAASADPELSGLPTITTSTSGSPTNSTLSSSNTFGAVPSTVLFFVAISVGAVIALFFVYFTLRYFVRSKYGLTAYSFARMTSGASVGGNNSGGDDTDGSGSRFGIQNGVVILPDGSRASLTSIHLLAEQLDYIRGNQFLRNIAMESRMSQDEIRRRRRRLRRRRRGYAKRKKLSEEEVEILFPRKSYYDWLHGGQERDSEQREDMLKEEGTLVDADVEEGEEDSLEENQQTTRVNDHNDVDTTAAVDDEDTHSMHSTITITRNDTTPANSSKAEIDHIQTNLEQDLATTDHVTNVSSNNDTTKEELHFTSGTCAICLDQIEDDEIVRGLICGHVFHAECLDPWLTKRRACCPMCKRDYLFKRDRVGGNDTASDNNNEDANSNENNNENNDDDDDAFSFDLEEIRNDPAFQTMLAELIPPSERVRMILENPEYSQLNFEEDARAMSSKKYGGFPKLIWWRLMGISKEDLFNWAVLTLFQQYRQDHPEAPADATTTNEDQEAAQPQNERENGNNEEGDVVNGNTTASTPEMVEMDIVEADRRSIVENRV